MFEKLKSYKLIKEQAHIALFDAKYFGADVQIHSGLAARRIPKTISSDNIFMILDEYIEDCGPGDLHWYKIMFDSSYYMICSGPNDIEEFNIWFEEVIMDNADDQ